MRAAVLSLAGLCLFSLLGFTALSEEPASTAVLVKTIETKDDLAIIAAWAPDGRRLAYGTELRIRRRSAGVREAYVYPGEVWVTEVDDEDRRRILKHDAFRDRRGDFFSFSVERLGWSPDGQRLLVELTDEEKSTATFFLTHKGKKVKVGESSRNFVAGYGGAWLGDSQSVGLLEEALAPRLLHRVQVVRVRGGRVLPLFPHHVFAAVAWLPRAQQMVGVERDPEFARPPQLARGDLRSGELELLAEVEDYIGGLQASPDETRVSYFVGQEELAVRVLAADSPVEHWPVPFGRYQWWPRRGAVLFIEPEAPGERSGWLTAYDPARDRKQRVLPQEKIQDFWVSPHGQHVAVLTVGLRPRMKIYRLPTPAE
ncbi:MAG: hypothetical protein V3U28_02030 [Candidatus Acidoferrales bacterium]